eukprot:m.83389 g.83389  ORF g.83389 m.83389 type:complete len:268 (-) comp16343_c0_seq2:156-959(-)
MCVCAESITVVTNTAFVCDLKAVRSKVAESTGVWPSGAVDVITMLCEFGAVFNPIVIFLCWDSPDRNRVEYVVSEVSNTPWEERTVQVLPMSEATQDAKGRFIIERTKSLHVSPFNEMPNGESKWRYTFDLPGPKIEHFYLKVEMFPTATATFPRIVATMDLKNTGASLPWYRRVVPASWLTLVRIHVQAAKLFLFKGVSFHDNVTQPCDTAPEAPHIVSFVATTSALAMGCALGTYHLLNIYSPHAVDLCTTYAAQFGDIFRSLFQ